MLTALCEALGGKLSDQLHRLYELALSDIDASVLSSEQLLATLLKTSKFVPRPAEIREACGAFAPASIDKPSLAWASFRPTLRLLNEYDSVGFDDPVVNATIRAMGGWASVHEWTTEEMGYRERDFLRQYSALQQVDLSEEQTKGFVGLSEAHNKAFCFRIEQVIVGCLSVGTSGIRRIAVAPETKKIDAPKHFLTQSLAKSLPGVIEHKAEKSEPPPPKSRDQQLAELTKWDQSEAWRRDRGWMEQIGAS